MTNTPTPPKLLDRGSDELLQHISDRNPPCINCGRPMGDHRGLRCPKQPATYQRPVIDHATTMSAWIDRDMRVGDRLFPVGTVTIVDILDHAARLAASPPHDGDVRERVARKLCELGGYKPDALEPGDDPHFDNTSFIDGQMPNGDPGHFRWRQFERNATTLLAILPSHSEAIEQAARVAEAPLEHVGMAPRAYRELATVVAQDIARRIRALASTTSGGECQD